MSQTGGLEEESEESSNPLQDVQRQPSGNGNGLLDRSTDSSETSSTFFSVTSESSLFVPTKLCSNITALKQHYISFIKEIDPNSSKEGSADSGVLMLSRDQLLSYLKSNSKANGRVPLSNREVLCDRLATFLDLIRPVILPDYKLDTRPKYTQSSDTQLSNLAVKVETMCSQNRDDYESLRSELVKLQNSLTEY